MHCFFSLSAFINAISDDVHHYHKDKDDDNGGGGVHNIFRTHPMILVPWGYHSLLSSSAQ